MSAHHPHASSSVVVHLLWSTARRADCLDASLAAHLYEHLSTLGSRLGCEVLAIGGVSDHVHLLVRVSPSLSLATLVRTLKRASARRLTRVHGLTHFAWREGFEVFALRADECDPVRRYIEQQPLHHAFATTVDAWEPRTR